MPCPLMLIPSLLYLSVVSLLGMIMAVLRCIPPLDTFQDRSSSCPSRSGRGIISRVEAVMLTVCFVFQVGVAVTKSAWPFHFSLSLYR